MDYMISAFKEDLINVPSGSTSFQVQINGYKELAFFIPVAMNGKTMSYQVYNRVTDSWVSLSSYDELLATGVLIPDPSVIQALSAFPIIRCLLNSATSIDSTVQVNMKA